MPPPMMTTSYSFIDLEVRELALECVNTLEHTNFACLSPFANSAVSLGAGFGLALFLEADDRCVRGDLDFPIDNRALGDRDGARADPAADDGCVPDLQLILDRQASQDGAGDDRLLRANM